MDVILPYLKRRVMILVEGVVDDWEVRLERMRRMAKHRDGRMVASE